MSYPRDGLYNSVNKSTPEEGCYVKYVDFDQAIALCLQELQNDDKQIIYVRKSDYKSAFRKVGLDPESWPWLVLKAESPFDRKIYYFVDKCLPFRHSISCAIFQEISDAIAHIVQVKIQRRIINYLDDYLFISVLRSNCNEQIQLFLDVCKRINMPISEEKTFWSEETMTFLGFLINGRNHMVMVPLEKVAQANQMLDEILRPGKKKITVLRLQQICGFFNFLCRCFIPGRAFTRRLYNAIPHHLKAHHHIKINAEMRLDMSMWRQFLNHPSVFSWAFANFA